MTHDFGTGFRALSPGGIAASLLVGAVAVAAGWRWGVLLVSFFVAAILLSRLGAERKEGILRPLIAKHGPRDAIQVLANGGVFLVAAIGEILSPSPAWLALGGGSLAAAAADTWATEIGTLSDSKPRSILSGKRVPAGTSGAITVAGTLAGVAGACFMAMIARLLGWPIPFFAVVVAGVGGATLDSLLGATLQERYWCEACALPTERDVHHCGTRTRRAGGVPRFDNDVVNLACSAAGAWIALVLS